jgi:phosphotransferase system enzyme I (PtsI)
MIRKTVKAAKEAKIKVSLCGELAGDPLAISLMVGMELDAISMNPVSIPMVKKTLRYITKSQSQKLVSKVLTFATADEVEKYLKRKSSDSLPENIRKLHMVGG